jgi:hypothetical protein
MTRLTSLARSKARVLAPAAIVATTALVLPTATTVQASTGTITAAQIQKSWSYVPEHQSAPAIDEGTLTNSSGQPVTGATIVLFPITLTSSAPGSVLPALARAVTNSTGKFTLRLAQSQLSNLVTARTPGMVNFDVAAFYPDARADMAATVDVGSTEPVISRLVLRSAAAQPSKDGPTAPAVCTQIGKTKKIPHIPTIMGYSSSLSSALGYAGFKYTTKSLTQMGFGVSYSGPYIGFTQTQTTTQTAGGSFAFPHKAGKGAFDYLGVGLYYREEYRCGSPKNGYQNQWDMEFNSVSNAAGEPAAKPVHATNCDGTMAGSTNTYTQGKQTTWKGGVSLKAEGFNINMSSQDGWSTSSALTYEMHNAGLPVCGMTNYPNSTDPSAGYLQVNKR